MKLVAVALVLSLIAPAPLLAKPRVSRSARAKIGGTKSGKLVAPLVKSIPQITVAHGGELRPAIIEVAARRDDKLTLEDETAQQIAKLLRGPLRGSHTGLFVADARTGAPLFAINADDAVNPASNVKMISTAAALELLGPDFRYTTRLLGPMPQAGVVHGDVFLLGSYDPTLRTADLDELATAVAARGVTAIDGNIVVGSDPTRDGLYHAIIPIDVTAGEPGHAPTATAPIGADHVTLNITAKTTKRAQRPRLTYKTVVTTEAGRPRLTVTIGGTIGNGGHTTYNLVTRERTATAVYALRAALRAHGVAVSGDLAVAELGDFVGDAVGSGSLPLELGRHESQPLSAIVLRVNKWSVNWLADRVIMTAAALTRHQPPSMDVALDAMYGWLGRHANIGKQDVLLDTGSGLSYRTQISTHELATVIRSAAGFTPATGAAPEVAHAWLDSLSIAGTDGTLRRRFHAADVRGKLHGKTGSLSTVIALSGVLDIDPQRPVVFSLVTNTQRPLAKGNVRRAHEQVVNALCAYLAKTAAVPTAIPAPPVAAPAVQAPTVDDEVEETEPEPGVDSEIKLPSAPAS